MAERTFYQILQVDSSADDTVILAAYTQLLAKYHPDSTTEPDAAQRRSEIAEAFAILSQAEKRREYDLRLRSATPNHQIVLQKPPSTLLGLFRNKQRLPVERDALAEDLHSIILESCTAYYQNTLITVLGELAAISIDPVTRYKEVHILVYDEFGDVLARSRGCWGPFGARQSFEVQMENALPAHAPVRVKVFPAGHL
ncbi:MAG: DnaJ domain-containing protein [Chloroflexaceae bacterium]|nr:DnaJ domain-containing protein [Chloroflexaceae bacterium]